MDYLITIPISKLPGVNWQKMLPISMNQYLRMNRWTRSKLNNLWYNYIYTQVNNQKIPLMIKPRIMVFIYFPTDRTRDWQNYCFKPIYDALVKAGAIEDDNDLVVDIKKPNVRIDIDKPRTEIYILGNEEI